MEKKTMTTKSCHPPLPRRSEDPWLVYTHGNRKRTQSFYSISEDRYYSKSIPELNNNEILTCSHGWLVMLGRENDVLNCFLLNPVSMRKIKLPQWRDFNFKVCVLTGAPDMKLPAAAAAGSTGVLDDIKNCVAVAFFESGGPSVMFCCPGDIEWTMQELPLERTDHGEVAVGIDSAVSIGRKIYGLVGIKKKLVIIDVDASMLTLRYQEGREKVPLFSSSYSAPCFSRHLVESCSEVFFVLILYIKSGTKGWEYGKFKIPRIEVFKLDFEKLDWKKVKTLGDHRAFLIGNLNCLSCPSSSSSSSSSTTTRTLTTTTETTDESEEEEEEGVKANCIYFTMPSEDKNLYVFDLEEGTISVSFLFPSVVHNMFGPDWILPICNS